MENGVIMGFFGKIKKGMKAAATAHKMDDFLVEEMSRIYQQQGYPVGGLKKTPGGPRLSKKSGQIKHKPEKYSFSVTTGNGEMKIKTKSEGGVVKASTKLGGVKGRKDKFKVNSYVHNDGGKLTVKNGQELAGKVMGLL